ncbi:substrate-binding domain-containing protein [Mesorhizobium sp. LjNodule214]|uniref:substrate-binding domain-containing protein n=1 Tax=Mesorhizobium sp. LjNodule214 TaxID=3342252 RepID=UPI003ECDBA27
MKPASETQSMTILWRIAAVIFVLAITAAAVMAQDVKPKVAFLLKTMQEERYETDRKLFTQHAEQLGADVIFDSANNDEELQLSQFEKILDGGIDVIVFQPVNTGTAGALVAMANQRGVRVVGYDSMLTGGPLDVMVMQDSWAVGKLQGEAMVEWLKAHKGGKAEGNVALIMGQPGDSNAQALSSGVLQVIAQNPGLHLVAQRSHEGWSPDAARETAEALLVKYDNKIDAFICNNSGMAYGVMGALQAEKLADGSKVFVAGADADLRNVRLVAEGKQSIDVWKKIEPLANRAAEVAIALAKNKDKPVTELVTGFTLRNNGAVDVPTIVTPVVVITKDTIDSSLIAEGAFTREQIYSQ